eukprot:SAG22_NODE_4728_length_1180_cov_1.283071_2_plen_74_part_00
MITDDVIAQFKQKFSDYTVAKPSICNGLDKCDVYRLHTDSPVPEELREPEPEPLSAVEPHIAVGAEEEDDEGA